MDDEIVNAIIPQWILSSCQLPTIGQLIVCKFASGSVWAGKYIGAKQTFPKWMGLPE